MNEVESVLHFWFGDLDERGVATAETVKRWWTKLGAFDAEIYSKFGRLIEQAVAGELEHWRSDPESMVAYIVVLDQFTRNVGRGTARMYAGDARALSAAHLVIEQGWIDDYGVDHAVAVLMPFMHSEDLADHDVGTQQFDALAARYPDVERLANSVLYMHKHRVIVEQFGCYPHRNEILGRASTPEELAFLKRPGSSF